MTDCEAPARWGLPDRLRTRAAKVGAWVHAVGSLQKLFCGLAFAAFVGVGLYVACSATRDVELAWTVPLVLLLAWLGIRQAKQLERVGHDFIAAARDDGDPHASLERGFSQLCSVLLVEAIFGAALSVVIATTVVIS